MNINTITAEDLRRMPDKEGLILQGCGGDLTEWVDGINEMLTNAGILKDGSQFENVFAFQHGELTCLLYPFDDVKLDIGKLALWRLQTHEVYGGTWLSDFVPNYLGGFIETPEPLADKPDCPLIGADGNIFNLLGIVSVDLFERANASIKRFSLSNKKPRDYLLRGKVFCGCCDHAMSLRNGAWFYCRHSEVAETLPCHGVRIKMADLEQVVFETIRAQMCPALGIDSNKDKLDLQTVQQTEHEEKLRSIQDSKRYLYEQYALGEIDLETYRTRKAVYDTELVQAKNVHAVITAQTKQIKSDYEIKLKQQEIVQKVGNANMLTKALIDRLINKVYVFPGDRIEIEYATQDFLETKESEKEV